MDKLPLQNILRQLLCGAVFFASIGVLLPNKAKEIIDYAHVNDSGAFWLGCAFVLSLAVGTLIYHIEKNFYSYFIQRLLGWKNCPFQLVFWCGIILAILSGVGIGYVLYDSLWDHIKWVEMPIITKIVLIVSCAELLIPVMLFPCGPIKSIVSETRHLWLAESGENGDKVNSVIMRRVANWSDFIHCGQCCAFAWILGSFCVWCYCCRYDPGNVPYVRIDLGLLCSLLLLALELIADWHRYHHVLYILNNNAKGESEFDPTSNSQQ